MRRLAPVLLLLSLLLFAARARAHDPFEITAVGQVGASELTLRVTMARSTQLLLARGDDSEAAQGAVARSLFQLTSRGAPLALRTLRQRTTEERDVELNLVFARPLEGTLRLDAVHLANLSETHGVALSLTQLEPSSVLGVALLTRSEPSLEVHVAAPTPHVDSDAHAVSAARDAASQVTSPAPATPPFTKVFALGVEHILTGYDHLLFLGGLLIACRKLRTMLAVVTSFTLAHSFTLALAGLDLVRLPGSIIEPLIAASIVFVGVENLWAREEPRFRWALTFVFGLIHGFGFAGALGELALGQGGTSLVLPLFAFNLGVEAGQLAVALLVLPLLLWLRRRGLFEKRAFYATSLAVMLFGVHWFVERTALGADSSEVAADRK